MKLPKDGYFSKFTHVEIARFFPEDDRLKRIMKGAEPAMIPWEDIYSFSSKYDDLGIYHSVRHYTVGEGILGPSLAPMHFDIDNKENPELAYADTQRLIRYLLNDISIPYDAIRVYFSGMKGYHVELEPLAVKLNLVHEDSAAIFRFVAEDTAEKLGITSFDFAVYDQRRIWRLAGSRHQKTGLYKIPCKDLMLNGATLEEIVKHAEHKPTAEDLYVPDQQFDHHAAMFFSEMVARYEAENWRREQDKLDNFLSSGHSKEFNSDASFTREFNITRLRRLCPAVDQIINKAKETKYLEHYERLFLCSLFTYTSDGIEYLHKILSNLEDYNFNISDMHIRDWVRRRELGIGGRPYTCTKAKSMGIICSGCEELQPKTYRNRLGAEHLADPSPIRFAYKYHEIGE